ncbi:MAG: 1-acyl-sn-glycerol-3-phosphate acyltransferase [Pseudomonadales bacterium]|nr:1-acyl-sn-glycerol-3-phosphate acyltransferase [Pseudomonadales bacterium]
MQEFDAIRPYTDDEVPPVVRRLVSNPQLLNGASHLFTPRLARFAPAAASWLARQGLLRRTRDLATIADVQRFLAGYMHRLVEETVVELTVTGFEQIEPGTAYLFVSNHRDIFMDSGLLNYRLYQSGQQTCRVAVGDNLLAEPYVEDLMRVNKSFVIERSVTGKRAIYAALSRSSNFIRHSLEQGHSVWIAQREGRAKDGFDRTEPAVLKMLALAYRGEQEAFGDFLGRVQLVPVSVTYELDPCDEMKAHELAVIEREGKYEKAPGEDLRSIVAGMTGFKGRVQLHLSAPLAGDFEDADDCARALDKAIVGGLKVFPTHAAAAAELGMPPVKRIDEWLPAVRADFTARLARVPAEERKQLLAGYANLVRNRREMGFVD